MGGVAGLAFALTLLISPAVSTQGSAVQWKPPFEILPAPATAGSLESQLQGTDTAVWLEGDVLTILRRDKAKQVHIIGGVGDALLPIEGTDLKILQARMKGWDRAIVSYTFFTSDPDAAVTAVPLPKVWRGVNAPKAPEEAGTLQGQVLERTIRSERLNEDRKLTIYLPPKAPKSGLPVFYMADGQACRSYAQILEPLILAGKMKPAAIVGIHSGGYRGNPSERMDLSKNFRAKEYIPRFDPERYEAHMDFFCQEVPAWAQREYGLSLRREDNATFGYSNGGSMAAAAALRHPERFAQAIPLSMTPPPVNEEPKGSLKPRLHLVVGELESPVEPNRAFLQRVKSWGVPATLEAYVAGHDDAMWRTAFAKYAPMVFPR